MAEINLSGYPIVSQHFKSTNTTIHAVDEYQQLFKQLIQFIQGKMVLIVVINDGFDSLQACFTSNFLNDLHHQLGAVIIVDDFNVSQRSPQSYEFLTKLFPATRFTNTFEEADAMAVNTIGLPFL